MKILTVILAVILDIIPFGEAFLRQLQKRDSILVADQLEYGFRLDGADTLKGIALPDFEHVSGDTLTLVRSWQLDTLKGGSLEGTIVIAPFEEGQYVLPDIPVLAIGESVQDTLIFKGLEMEVKTIPIDTATFEIHDIKGQMTYPVTFAEVLPWILGVLAVAALVWLLVFLARRYRSTHGAGAGPADPPHVVALRALDRYRGDKYWAPERQKAFYSGVTDALKQYIDDVFGIDAPEMTTAELFDALKGSDSLTPELYGSAKELFERADFVKFAKHTASDEENAHAIPTAVRFVTSTYQTQLDAEAGKEAAAE